MYLQSFKFEYMESNTIFQTLLLFSLLVVSDSCDPMDYRCQVSLSFTIVQSLLKHVRWVNDTFNHLILCWPCLLLPSIFVSIRIFSNESALCIRWQSIRASALAAALPMNIQNWFPLELTGFISLLSKRLSRVFSNTTIQKNQFFGAQPSLWFNSHIHTWLLGKIIALTRWTFVCKVMSPLFNILSRFVKTFLPRSKTPWCHCQNQRTGLHADVIFTLRNRQYLMYPLISRATSARVCQLDTIFQP